MIIYVRGFKIRCAAKPGNKAAYGRLYGAMTDERLAELEVETLADERQANE